MSCTGLLYLCGKSSKVASWTALVPSTLVALWGITAQSLNWAGNMRDTRHHSTEHNLFVISFGDDMGWWASVLVLLTLAVCQDHQCRWDENRWGNYIWYWMVTCYEQVEQDQNKTNKTCESQRVTVSHGETKAGSSIFAVVYASVTIWSALLSRLLLQQPASSFLPLRFLRFLIPETGPQVEINVWTSRKAIKIIIKNPSLEEWCTIYNFL